MIEFHMVYRLVVNNIPNFVTIVNSFLGFSSILASFQAVIEFQFSFLGKSEVDPSTYLALAGVLIILATIFDFLDGILARFLNVSSKIGKEMDSFADLVSFGIAPGVLFFTVTMIAGNHIPDADIFYRIDRVIPNSLLPHILFLKILAFACPTCVIIRLARFNINSDKPNLYFEGIPSTFGGGFIALIFTFNYIKSPAIYFLSLFDINFVFIERVNSYFHPFFHDYFFLLIAYLFISVMMVSRISYRKIGSIIKYFSKKKYFILHIVYVFCFLFLFRYTVLFSMITYIVFGFKRQVKKTAVLE